MLLVCIHSKFVFVAYLYCMCVLKVKLQGKQHGKPFEGLHASYMVPDMQIYLLKAFRFGEVALRVPPNGLRR